MTAADTINRHERAFDKTPDATLEMLVRLIRFFRWTNKDVAYIRDDREALVPIRLNLAQQRILARMMDQAAAGEPVRVVCGKARKHGASTLIQLLFVFLCAHYHNQRAITLAHEADATDEIFDIAQRAARQYPGVLADIHNRVIRHESKGSRYTCHTAGGVAVGAGGTPNLLHLSELAKWERNKAETEYNAKIAVPDTPTSIVFVESTFKGRDLFCERFDEAADPGNPYDQLFNAWYLDDRCAVEAPEGFTPDTEERSLIGRAHREGIELSNDQLEWRRRKRKELGDEVFRQEYPSTPTEAIQAASGIILPGMRECIVDELPFDPQLIPLSDRAGGIDFGYCDAAVIWTAFYLDQVLWVTGFWRGIESLACDQLDGLEEGHTYWCDPAQVTDRRQLAKEAREQGLHVKLLPAPRRKHPGEDCSTVELKALVRLGEQGRLRVMRDVATQLIVECDSFMWNETTGKADERRTAAAGHFDSIMALKYMVMGVDKPVARPPQAKARVMSRREGFARY